MNNSTNSNHEQQLHTWRQIISDCMDARASGIKVKDWLRQQGISHDTYYYWYKEVKKAYIDNSLPDIVPVSNEIITTETIPVLSDNLPPSLSSATVIPSSASLSSCIRLTINGISIEVNELTDQDSLQML